MSWYLFLLFFSLSPLLFFRQVVDRISFKQLTSHLRIFCDLLVCDISKSTVSGHVTKCIEYLNNLIWKYNIIALDRLVLCMALRTNEGNEAQVFVNIIIQVVSFEPCMIFGVSSFRDILTAIS